MKRNQYKLFIVLMITITFFYFPACRSNKIEHLEIKVEEIEVEKMLDLSSLQPKIDEAVIVVCNNAVAIDLEGNLYFPDSQKHRVLKFSSVGKFIKQIGRIGMGKEGLYYPSRVYFKDGKLYILDYSGRNVKIYNTDGEFISWLKLENAYEADTVVVDNGELYLNVLYNDQENYNNQKLISRFSGDGKKIKQFGRIIRSHKFIGYTEFNSCFLKIANNKLYGAFKNYPAIFCYSLTGKEIFYRDFKESSLPEIRFLNDTVVKSGADTPLNHKTPGWGITTVCYFTGLSVDPGGRIYLPLNYLKKTTWHSVILCIDPGGNPLVKYRLRTGDGPVVRIRQLLVRGYSDFYAIGCIVGEKTLSLFRFKKGGK